MNRHGMCLRSVVLLMLALGAWSCNGGSAAANLMGTRWRLVELASRTVEPDPRNEPYLVFDAGAKRAMGSGGCNQISGPFEQKGNTLRLGPIIATRMACDRGMETEQAFLDALEATRAWKITGQRLELQGDGGRWLARLEVDPEA